LNSSVTLLLLKFAVNHPCETALIARLAATRMAERFAYRRAKYPLECTATVSCARWCPTRSAMRVAA